MKADKTILKVKSKTERRIMDEPELEMISEWNFKKIIYALIVLALLVILPAYYFSSLDDSDTEKSPPEDNELVAKNVDSVKEIAINKPAIGSSSNITTPKKTPVQDDVVKDEQQVSVRKTMTEQSIADRSALKSSEQIAKQTIQEEVVVKNVQKIQANNIQDLNPNISRAQLAQGVNKLEPYGEIKLPILVDTSKAQSVTYFTEVNNMQGDYVFHQWLKEGKSIYKRKINIRGDKWRISTSKLFPFNSIGQWQVRIITQQGDILHKINFSVEKR